MENSLKEYLSFAKKIAKFAGRIMKKYSKSDMGATYKGDKTIVTKADKEINNYLINEVKKKYPKHSVSGEENSFGFSDYIWVCDPIDGTAMFARNIPVSVFSLALVYKGESVLGVVYNPWLKELYTAIKGQGAFLNGKRIHVNDYDLYDERAVSNYDMWHGAKYNINEIVSKLNTKTYMVSIGSCVNASMKVATGDFVLQFFPGGEGKHYDIAAAKIIVEEAGGRVTNFYGENEPYNKEINGAVVSNGVVHDQILELINQFIKK